MVLCPECACLIQGPVPASTCVSSWKALGLNAPATWRSRERDAHRQACVGRWASTALKRGAGPTQICDLK